MSSSNRNKRRQILEAGLKSFAKYGFEKATIKRIAREAKISTTSIIYWYFKDKNELLQAVLNESLPLVNLVANPDKLMEQPPEEVLLIIARTFLHTYDDPDMTKVMRIFFAEAAKDKKKGTQFAQTGMMTILNFLVKYHERQINLGRFRPHDTYSIVRSFIGMLVIYVLSQEMFPPLRINLPDKEQYIQEVVANFIRGLHA